MHAECQFIATFDRKHTPHAPTDYRYDLARDHIVGNITGWRVEREKIGAEYILDGSVEKRGWRYTTTVYWDDTLLDINRSEYLSLESTNDLR